MQYTMIHRIIKILILCLYHQHENSFLFPQIPAEVIHNKKYILMANTSIYN